ncbi:MAG: hypothetical protein H6922_03010 [Pseudomonadaceae bacterium]|nr:hypothetical protein [Pseudomonadaceae bacterium]
MATRKPPTKTKPTPRETKAKKSSVTIKKPQPLKAKPATPANQPAPERLNIDVDMPDFNTWGRNALGFAKANPAALVAGALAVLLALMLMFP